MSISRLMMKIRKDARPDQHADPGRNRDTSSETPGGFAPRVDFSGPARA